MDIKGSYIALSIKNYDKEYKAPYLCEVWNWEGDQSVLPYKVNGM
jgi:hypothetical protein